MFFGGSYYYYIPLILQAICAIHCLRSGNQSKWLWVIVFLPVIGSCFYLYSEVLNTRKLRNVKIDAAAILNPGIKIKRLEEAYKFSDTFANKTKLADAYLNSGQTDKAIELYESCLTGAFEDNEQVISQLIVAYYEQENYAEVIAMAAKIRRSQKFNRSKAHLLYALSLERTHQADLAEMEFKAMKGRYSNFEQRYEYGRFLQRAGRIDDAFDIYAELLDEEAHLSKAERSGGRVWFTKAKQELKRIETGA
jgi:hypothetical protein